MSKNYRYIITTPQEICQWANNSQLILGDKEKRVATRGDMQRVRSLVSLGLPFPQLVLAEYVDGKTIEVSSCLRCWSCFRYFVLCILCFVAGKGYTYAR